MKKAWTKKAMENFGFCMNHSGKMKGMISFSTSNLMNPRCIARAKNKDLICSHCYAMRMENQYSNLDKKLIRNTDFITSHILKEDEIPIIDSNKYPLVRFESFGDILNVTQVLNYFLIANENSDCQFALWSKNMDIVASAIDIASKPSNLIVIESSPKMNDEIKPSYDFIDKTFTVFDTDGEHINCGARNCATCQKCYHINEYKALYELVK